MPLYLKAGTSSLLRVGTSLASNSACCCATGCTCTCQPSTVSFTASAVSFYIQCCNCVDGVATNWAYLTIPAMTNVPAYKCCDANEGGSGGEFIFYASNPVLLGTFNLMDYPSEIFCSNAKSTTIYAFIGIQTLGCGDNVWQAQVRLYGYYGTGECSSVQLDLDRSIDPCSLTGVNGPCLLACYSGVGGAGSGISISDSRSGNFCSPTGTYEFNEVGPLASPIVASPLDCGTSHDEVYWTLTVS